MKSILIRNLRDETVEKLAQVAEANHRSLQQQLRLILESEASLERVGMRGRAAQWRSRLAGRQLGDVVADVRSGRDR